MRHEQCGIRSPETSDMECGYSLCILHYQLKDIWFKSVDAHHQNTLSDVNNQRTHSIRYSNRIRMYWAQTLQSLLGIVQAHKLTLGSPMSTVSLMVEQYPEENFAFKAKFVWNVQNVVSNWDRQFRKVKLRLANDFTIGERQSRPIDGECLNSRCKNRNKLFKRWWTQLNFMVALKVYSSVL